MSGAADCLDRIHHPRCRRVDVKLFGVARARVGDGSNTTKVKARRARQFLVAGPPEVVKFGGREGVRVPSCQALHECHEGGSGEAFDRCLDAVATSDDVHDPHVRLDRTLHLCFGAALRSHPHGGLALCNDQDEGTRRAPRKATRGHNK